MIAVIDPFWATVVATIPATIASVFAWRNAKGANDAVNHRQKDEPRMLDIMKDIRDRLESLEDSFIHHLVHHDDDKGV